MISFGFPPSASRHPQRRGIACIWAVVVLAVLTGMMAAITVQQFSSRRWIDQRQNQFQTIWLTRAGVELAADRLLKDPTGYKGESVELIPASQMKIDVRPEPDAPNTFRVTCEARYPTDGRPLVVRTLERRLRRTVENGRARID
jgi:hypothetical protein